MSSVNPGTSPIVPTGVPPRHRCHICMRNMASATAKAAHDLTEHHIMRCCKMKGWPTAMCVLCHCFALLPVEDHICTELHVAKCLQFPHYNGPAIQIVAYPRGLYTESQRQQLTHSDAYVVVYTNHIRLHHELFADYHQAHVEAGIDELYAEFRMALEQVEHQHSQTADWLDITSPELSTSESEDESQFHTPVRD